MTMIREILKLLVVSIFCVAVLLITGCATVYEIERVEPDGSRIVASIKSRREFTDGLSIEYDRETGNFTFSANQVTTAASPLEEAAAQIILTLPGLVAPITPE